MAVGFNLPNGAFRLTAEEAGGQPDYYKAIENAFKGIQNAAETAYKPKTMAEMLLAQQLANKFQAPRSERADEFAQADLNYKNALSQQARMGLNPFNRLSGAAKDAYSIELLKRQLGEESPAYQSAKSQYDLEQESARGLNDYRKGLADTMLKRSSSNLGKLSQEEEDINAGFEPNTNRQHQISPDRQEELLGQYALTKQKIATDADTRKKTLFASNIDKTIDSIDTKDLTQFAGLNGAIKLKQEELKAATKPGTESEEYKRYLESANKAQLLAKQVRQFYGDSIQPAMLQQLQKLSNPATWRTNPEIATRLFNSFTGLLKQETGTYRGALKSKGEYEGQRNIMSPSGSTRVYYNGKPHMIPNEQVDAALRAGGSLNG